MPPCFCPPPRRRRPGGLPGLAVSFALSLPLLLQPTPAQAKEAVALVLSGGGARGAAHVGVLKVLEELRIPVDCVVGTSMGAIVGGAYASGMTAGELEAALEEADWAQIFSRRPDRRDQPYSHKDDIAERRGALELGVSRRGLELPKAVAGGQQLDRFLITLTGGASPLERFDWLPLPFRSVATDLENGDMVVFKDGPLWEAMRASMSVPGVFAPHEVQGRLLVDGGLVRNLPVDLGRALCGEAVIAVNLGTPPWDRSRLASASDIALQAINLTLEQNVNRSLTELSERDVLISPQLGTMTSAAFTDSRQAVAAGEAATRAMAGTLARFSVSPEAYDAWRKRLLLSRKPVAPVVVDAVELRANRRWGTETLKAAIAATPGTVLDEAHLRDDLDRVRALADYERVGYRLLRDVRDAGRNVLAVDAYGKSWGPNYLRLGGGLKNDFEGGAAYSFFAGLDLTDLNEWRGSWRNELQVGAVNRLRSEWLQPLGPTSPWFVAPSLGLESYLTPVYEGVRHLRDYRIGVSTAAIDLGRDLGRWGQARIGLERGLAQATLAVGEAGGRPESQRINIGNLTTGLTFDTLDKAYFPSQGTAGSLRYTGGRRSLGDEGDYDKITLELSSAWTAGVHTVEPTLLIGGSPHRERDLPVYDQYVLGGFQQLSGYRLGQLRADALAFGRLSYRYRIAQLSPGLGGNVYLGATIELARLQNHPQPGLLHRDTHASLGAFLGVDSPLGPLYLGVGHAPKSHAQLPASTTFYLQLGRP